MRTRLFWVLGFSVATLSGLQACGSSDGGGRPRDDDGGSGTGGKSTGGRPGTGGAPGGAGGSMLTCNTAPCDAQITPLQGLLGMFGGGISLKACCVNATTCGIDTSGIGMLLGVSLPGCVDPSTLVMPPPPPVVDSGAPPGIQLDKACPGITTTAFSLPGCCRPTGTCGGSTHTVQGAGTTVPIACVSYDAAAMSAAAAGLNVVVPDDPNIRCTYTLGPANVPEAGVPDASPESGPPAPAPDASQPGHPDSGAPSPDAASTSSDAASTSPTTDAANTDAGRTD